ncbi:MAG: hypothetical protein A2283_10070 [Lentisphaerae bacterium RIFOXYA12_FULL_48_11]|nr:MAG: hypothetical protein A2283_10070 [Lentisphaerae bacterium RIFOXYA12_FULL_48_11]
MEGKIIDCPQCNKAIPLFSKNSHTPRIETQTDVAITPPEWPDQPSCPGCHTAMAPNAVICLTCGLDLRTGQKFTLPQEKRKLSFKQEESPPDEPNNSVLVRYFMPKSRRKTISVKLFSVLKMISVLVIISGMGLAAVQYVDISAVINKIKGLFETTEPNVAKNIIQILETLRSKPGDYAALQELSVNIKNLTDTTDNRNIKCGMMTVFALGQLGKGNEQSGIACCEHIQSNYADTEFSRMVNKGNFYDFCPKCATKGEIRENCKVCSGGTKCKACRGSGITTITKAPPQGLARSSNRKSHSLGEAPSTTPQTTTVRCSSCMGSGKCSACKGIGFFASKCIDCDGTGKNLVKLKVKAQYDIALTKTFNLLEARIKEGKDLALSENTMIGKKGDSDIDLKTLKEMLADGTKINLFDGLIRICDEKQMPLSIDPESESLKMMSDVYVDISSLSSVTNTTSLNSFVTKYRLVVNQVPIATGSSNRVDFVTTPAVWIYSQACWYLLRNQITQAQKALATASLESSEFSIHCEQLRNLLQMVNENKNELSTLSATLRNALAKYKQNMANARTFETASKSGLQGPQGSSRNDGINAAAAETSYKRAEIAAQDAFQLLKSYLKKMKGGIKIICERFETARAERLYSEVYFLLSYLIDNYTQIQNLQKEIQENGFLDWAQELDEFIGDMPDQIKQDQTTYGGYIRTLSSDIDKLNVSHASGQNVTEGLRISEFAFSIDRANFMVRVGAGYFSALRNVKAMKDILYIEKLTDNQQADIAREFRTKNKTGLLQAFNDVADKKIPLMLDTESKLGSAVGLCTYMGQGDLSPISVKIQPVAANAVAHDEKHAGYWSAYVHKYTAQEKQFPISFGDYGYKDISMRISAIEVYKWLCNQYPTEMAGNGLHIEYHDLEGGKAGDSAGVTMGVAGYSFLNKIPIRRDVAMTGSIRSDGSVYPVGGVSKKIAGAQDADGVELVIIPKANEADAFFVPVNHLCRIIIISANDIETYINYATNPEHKKDTLHDLRRAQIFIMLGSKKKAEDILLAIAANNPEIYSARRLLELLAISWTQKAETK